jgi:hypothetical protein
LAAHGMTNSWPDSVKTRPHWQSIYTVLFTTNMRLNLLSERDCSCISRPYWGLALTMAPGEQIPGITALFLSIEEMGSYDWAPLGVTVPAYSWSWPQLWQRLEDPAACVLLIFSHKIAPPCGLSSSVRLFELGSWSDVFVANRTEVGRMSRPHS